MILTSHFAATGHPEYYVAHHLINVHGWDPDAVYNQRGNLHDIHHEIHETYPGNNLHKGRWRNAEEDTEPVLTAKDHIQRDHPGLWHDLQSYVRPDTSDREWEGLHRDDHEWYPQSAGHHHPGFYERGSEDEFRSVPHSGPIDPVFGKLTAHFAAARSYPAPGEPFSHMTHEQYDQYVRPHLEASELPPDDFINTNPPHHTQYHATPYSGKFPYDNWTHVGTRKAAEERATAVKPEHYGLPEGTRSSIYAVRLSGKVYPRVISDEMANDISGAGYDQAGRLLAEHGLPSGEGYHIFPYRNHTEDIGSVSYLAHHSAITRTAIITHEATAALGHPYLTNHAAVTPSHRFVRSSPTPGDPYRCTHPQCAEEWGPGQDQPTSRCPAPESTADIMKRKREQEMKLQQLQQASGESGDDQVGGGTEEDGEPKEEPGAKSSPAGHTAMISSLGNLIDAGAWNEPRREAERRA